MPTFYQIQAKGVKLAKRDGLLGKSDPFVVIKDRLGCAFAFSEIIPEELNPTWKPIELDVDRAGGMNAQITVEVMDYDADAKHDEIGTFSCTVQELVSKLNFEHQLLCKKKKAGSFIVTAATKEEKTLPTAWTFALAVQSIPKETNAFLKFYSLQNDAKTFMAMTSHHNNERSCEFSNITLSTALVGGIDTPLEIRLLNHSAEGINTFVGSTKATLRELIAESHWLTFVDPKKEGKAKYVNSGLVRVKSAVAAPEFNPQGPSQFNLTIKAENVDAAGCQLLIKKGVDTVLKVEGTAGANPTFSNFTLTAAQCGGLDTPLSWELVSVINDGNVVDLGRKNISLRRLLFRDEDSTIRLFINNAPAPASLCFLVVETAAGVNLAKA